MEVRRERSAESHCRPARRAGAVARRGRRGGRAGRGAEGEDHRGARGRLRGAHAEAARRRVVNEEDRPSYASVVDDVQSLTKWRVGIDKWRLDVDAGRAPLPDRIALYATLAIV